MDDMTEDQAAIQGVCGSSARHAPSPGLAEHTARKARCRIVVQMLYVAAAVQTKILTTLGLGSWLWKTQMRKWTALQEGTPLFLQQIRSKDLPIWSQRLGRLQECLYIDLTVCCAGLVSRRKDSGCGVL